MSQSAEGVVAGGTASQLPLRTRLAIAAPGAVAAALIVAGGAFLVVTGLSDSTLRGDDEFASIPAAIAFAGVVACVIGVLLAIATVVVSLARARPVLLTLAVLFSACGGAGAAYLLATGADGIVYAPLTAVLAYLTAVAALRLLLFRRATNA